MKFCIVCEKSEAEPEDIGQSDPIVRFGACEEFCFFRFRSREELQAACVAYSTCINSLN